MGEGSPLFHSALELLAHAIEHYLAGEERDRRFMILHLANAVELLLKDTCVDLGESIYKGPKETKTIWAVIGDLEKQQVDIPLKPILELLIEERNNIQHRFGSETEVMANWYMEKMLEFFEGYMSSRFNLSLRSYMINFIDPTVLGRVLPDTTKADPFAAAREAAQLQPAGAVLGVWTEVEKKLNHLGSLLFSTGEADEVKRPLRVPSARLLRRAVLTVSGGDEALLEEFRALQATRSRIVHGRTELDAQEALELIDRMASLLDKLETLIAGAQEPKAAAAADDSGAE